MSTCYIGRIIHGRTIVHLIVAATIVVTLIAGCGTAEPTATPMPPTATPVPPTPAPTKTPLPPTATLAPPTPAPTQTPIPPTDTPVPSTATPAPPTATATVLPPLSGSGGGVIAFSSERDGNSEIYVMNADGSDQRRLTYDPADDFHPSWSPDGSQLVFYSRRTGNADIFVMTVPDGTAAGGGEPGAHDLRQLTDDPANDYYPAWSPDGAPGGDQIVFDSKRDGNHEIYVMDADGSNQRRLTNTPGDEYFAAWSPDGTEIAFISDRDGNQEIYVMNADGSNQRRLTNTPANELEPDWSPDGAPGGDQIAFVSNRGGDRLEVYVMNADGSDPRRLTVNTSSENHHSPDWSPDGTRIVFAAKRDVYVMNVTGATQDTTSDDWLRLTRNSTQYEHFTTWRPSTGTPETGSGAMLRTYGGDRNDYLYDILLLADGGTLLAGQANNRGLSHRIMPGNAHLIRTDSEGDVIWEKDYAEEVDAMFYSLVQVGEDEYVVLGQIAASYSRNETDLYLVKIDGEGNEIWSHTYGGRGMDDAKMVRQTADGGFVLAGSQADEFPTDGGYQADVFLVKTDAEGNEVWTQTYGDTILDVAWGVVQTPDGGYVLAGWEAKTYDDRVVIAIKTDEMGEVEWSRSWNLDPGDRDGGYDLILTSDGYIVIACVQSMDSGLRGAALIKVDLDGNEIWVKTLGDEGVGNEFWDIMEDVDGGYVMAGDTLPGEVSATKEDIRQGLIIKTDPDGEVLWQHVFDEGEYDQLVLSSAVVLPDGGYIFVGRVVREDEKYADMLWLKLTSDSALPEAISTDTPVPAAAHAECAGLIPESTKAQVRQYVDQGLNAGIVVGIVAPCGREVYAYGETALSGGQAVDENTVFEIGSIGKTFTALLLADMVQRNEVSFDDPIEQFLPDSVTVPTYNGQSITLIDLATHSSGLPAIPDNLAPADEYNPYADYTVEQMYEALAQIELTRDIGSQYEYSNLGMGLLGHVLSLQSSMSYEELVVARIADELGMPDTRVTLTPGMQDRLATGYREEEPFPLWDNPTLAGAGALRSTVQDMLTFLAANVGLHESRLYEAMQLTHESHYLVNESMRVGLAWHIRTEGDLQIVEHHGATGGYWSFAGFVKDKQTGVVVLTNTFHDVDEIGLDLLRASTVLD